MAATPSTPIRDTPQPLAARAPAPASFSGRMVEIAIARDQGHDGKDDVPVGVEGRVLKIKRGARVIIPIEHYWRLMECRYDTVDESGEVNGEVPRYSVSFFGEVTDKQTAAAH